MKNSSNTIATSEKNSENAIKDIKNQLTITPSCLLLFFSPRYDKDALSQAIKGSFDKSIVFGCSTAGGIGPDGLVNDGIVAIAFEKNEFLVEALPIHGLQNMSMGKIQRDITNHFNDFLKNPTFSHPHRFAILLVDGLSYKEEQLVSVISSALDDLPLIGASAGDDGRLEQTFILANGDILVDSALLLTIESRIPFKIFKSDDLAPSPYKLVVTKADPEKRIVYELNNMPAAEIYAKAIRVDEKDLTELTFAMNPLTVRGVNNYYARSIKSVHQDGSFSFYCAIDEGIIFTLSQTGDIISSVSRKLNEVKTKMGEPELILGFDCILRRFIAEHTQNKRELEKIYKAYNVVGFNSYGEQLNGVHLNQTFTAIAFGAQR